MHLDRTGSHLTHTPTARFLPVVEIQAVVTVRMSADARLLGGVMPRLDHEGFRVKPVFQIIPVAASALPPQLVGFRRNPFAPVSGPYHEFLSRLSFCRRLCAALCPSRIGWLRYPSCCD